MSYYLAPSLVLLRDEVNSMWPNRSTASDGWIGNTAHSSRISDHNPDWNAGGVVRALDITAKGIDVDRVLAHTTNDSRVNYVIHDGEIYTHSRGWQQYTGPNPHRTHIHVSIRKHRKHEHDLKPWIPTTTTSTSSSLKGLSMSDINTLLERLEKIETLIHRGGMRVWDTGLPHPETKKASKAWSFLVNTRAAQARINANAYAARAGVEALAKALDINTEQILATMEQAHRTVIQEFQALANSDQHATTDDTQEGE